MGCFAKLGPCGDCAAAAANCEERCEIAQFFPLVVGEGEYNLGYLVNVLPAEATHINIFANECVDDIVEADGGAVLLELSTFLCTTSYIFTALTCDDEGENCVELCSYDLDVLRTRLPNGVFSYEVLPNEGCYIQVLLEINASTSESEGTYTITPIDEESVAVIWLGEYCGGELVGIYRIETSLPG